MNKLIPLSLMGVATIMAIMPNKIKTEEKKVESKNEVQILSSKSTIRVKADIEENAQLMTNNEENTEEMHNEIQKTVQNSDFLYQDAKNTEEQTSYETRMTSYYADDGYETGTCTGSGLCISDFQVNENGWYTYQGKLVVATATTYLANQGWYVGNGVHLRKYYNEITLTIDGVDYKAIVLDSCGNCMKTDRVDLYVSSVVYAKDTMVEVKY